MKYTNIEKARLKKCLIALSKRTQILTLDDYIQHGKTSCLWHSIAVAYYSLCMVQRFNIKCNVDSLIIGALLHDYFLYDWHIPDKSHRLHGFTHPSKALINAKEDWHINCIEEDIIKNHMFPLTLMPPSYKEGIIVCIVDKYCSIKEMINKEPYKELKLEYAL